VGHDSYWATKWLIDKIADKAIDRIAGIWLTGLAGVAIAAAAGVILIPNDSAADSVWRARCAEGPVYGVTLGFNT
jgi:hypothetical protein